MRSDTLRFLALDGWRGIAAIVVVLLHTAFLGHLNAVPLIANGHLFVDFFFVLSGFVISHAYGERLRQGTRLASFMLRRFGRLWPLHIAVLSAFVGLELIKLLLVETGQFSGGSEPFSDSKSVESLISNLFLAHALGMHEGHTWNAPSWSISVEFYTYLLFALAVKWSGAYMRPLSLGLALISLGLLAAGTYGWMDTELNTGLMRCLAGFFFGHLTYTAFVANRHRFDLLKDRTVLEIMLTTGLILFVSLLQPATANLLAPPLFSLMVFVFALEGGAISRALKRAPFRQFGEWSYSIYMVHALVFVIIVRATMVLEKLFSQSLIAGEQQITGDITVPRIDLGNPLLADLMTLAYVLIVIALSALSYRWIEEPGRRYFNRLAKGLERK